MQSTAAFVPTDDAPAGTAPLGLDPATAARLRRLRPADRDDHRAARALARALLARHTGDDAVHADPTTRLWEQVCPRCGPGHGHGAPRLLGRPGLGIGWAHAGGWIAAAVGPAPLGIDVELLGGPRPPAPDALTGPAPWRWFTRVEACVKAGLGDLDAGLAWPLDWAGPEGVLEVGGQRLLVTDWTDPAEAPRVVGALAVAPPRDGEGR